MPSELPSSIPKAAQGEPVLFEVSPTVGMLEQCLRRTTMRSTTRATSRGGMMVPAVAALALYAAAAGAADFPSRAFRVVVPQGAGGSTDLTARIVGQRLAEVFGQPVVVDNRPGAGSINGTDVVVKAAPNGYTLLVVGSSVSLNPLLHKNLPFDPARDLVPVSQLSFFSNLLVTHPSVPVKSVRELVALAKAKPGQLSFASSGTATGPHLSAE